MDEGECHEKGKVQVLSEGKINSILQLFHEGALDMR